MENSSREGRDHRAIQQLKGEILKDGLGVYGIRDAVAATRNGQAELLLVEKGYRVQRLLEIQE